MYVERGIHKWSERINRVIENERTNMAFVPAWHRRAADWYWRGVALRAGTSSPSVMNDACRPDQRLPKKEIIRNTKIFQEVIREGMRCGGRYLMLYYQESDQRQVGFAVPKRLGKAVRRNRVKRLMRETYRMHRNELGRFRVVILAKEEAKDARLGDLEKDIERFIRDVGK